MNKGTLKAMMKKEMTRDDPWGRLTGDQPKEMKKLMKLWDTVLLWSGYEGYFTINEIARQLKVKPKTVQNRLYRFRDLYPAAYDFIKFERKTIKQATSRLDESLSHPTQYNTSMDTYIVEKF